MYPTDMSLVVSHVNLENPVIIQYLVTLLSFCLSRNVPRSNAIIGGIGPGPHCGRCGKTVYDMEKAVGMTDVRITHSVHVALLWFFCAFLTF